MNLIPFLIAITLTVHVKTVEHRKHEKDTFGYITCTAVMITPNQALTAAHCISGPKDKIWVLTSDGKSFSATVKNINTARDLCLLQISRPPAKHAILGKPANIGDRVYTMSSEQDMPITYGEGIIENYLYDPTHTMTLVHSIALMEGGSGSGLFDSQGHLVGINTAITRAISYAVDETEIRYFLNPNEYPRQN